MTSATSSRAVAAAEWRSNWPMVLSALVGVSFVSIPPATLGLFMEPLQNEFGWTRTQISGGMTVLALVSLPLMPLAGALVDRAGARRVALPGLVLSGLAFAAFGLQGGSLAQWFATWVAFTLASLLIGLLVWTSAVSTAFQAGRGLALALVLCGAALALTLAPLVSRELIDAVGWRTAYFAIAAGWGGVAFVLSLVMFWDRRAESAADAGARGGRLFAIPGGLSVGEALRSLRMHRNALATFLQTLLGAAAIVHLVPLLTAAGLERAEAASLAALMGIASVTGKLVTGWLVDRISSGWLPVACYAGPGLAYLLLYQGAGAVPVLAFAVVLLGYCSGASLQLSTYLTTKYAGMRNFGKIFGLVAVLLALGGGLGPLVAGAIFDSAGSYEPLLIGGVIVGVLAGTSVIGLGAYPHFPVDESATTFELTRTPGNRLAEPAAS